MGFILVMTTTESIDNAHRIAKTLVAEKLAGCVNINHNTTSVYFWKGEIVEDKEFSLTIKTKSELFDKTENRIKELHTYEVPEIIALEIKKGSKEYLNWLGNEII